MRTPNLSREPFPNLRPLQVSIALLVVLALAATAVSVIDLIAARRTEEGLTARLQPLEQQRRELSREVVALDRDLAAVKWGKLATETGALNQVLATRRLVWTELLANLERIMPWDVRLVTISPAIDQDGEVVLSLVGISTGRQGWLALLGRLFADHYFSDPIPLAEQAPGATNALGYRFQVRAHYWPEGKS